MNASHPSPAFAKLLMDLGSRPQERTLNEIFQALDLNQNDYFLTTLVDADKILRSCGIEIQPSLQDGVPDGVYVLRKKDAGGSCEADVMECLATGETESQEFKSTYWCDLNKRIHFPDAKEKDLRSADVKHSTLKSLAGLITTGGGTLFIGVDDEGEILGLQEDLNILQSSRPNVDQLINNIKTDIAQKFRDGNTVNDYIRIQPVSVGAKQILKLEVASRRELTFLATSKNNYTLYRRQDNRTVPVEIFELEEFQTLRHNHILPSHS